MLNYTDIKFFKLAIGQEHIGKESDSDISARCPVCGDGSKKNSKRLHLYEKNGSSLVHCFNGDCDVHSNLWNFLKNHNPELLDSYKRETFGETMTSLGATYSEKPKANIDIKTVDLEHYLTPLDDCSEALEYINNRYITYDK